MTGPGGLLDLSGGARLVLDGRESEVASFEPRTGRVSLRGGGQELATTARALVNDPLQAGRRRRAGRRARGGSLAG